jgi:hypothetical protein
MHTAKAEENPMARLISTNETTTKCHHCGSTIAYGRQDVHKGGEEEREPYTYIVCPNPRCRRSISLDDKPLYDASDYDL